MRALDMKAMTIVLAIDPATADAAHRAHNRQ